MPYQGRQPGVGVRSRYIYTASGGQTTFSGADDNGKTLAYQDGAYVDVYLNGVMLVPSTDFTATTKTSVTLTSGATASDILEIVAYDISSIADTVSKSQGGTFDNDVTVNGTVTADGLTVESGIGNTALLGVSTDSGTEVLLADQVGGVSFKNVNGDIELRVNGAASTAASTRLAQKIDGATGDISFYEDTGTTPKLTWDSSEQTLSLSSVNFRPMRIHRETAGTSGVLITNATTGSATGDGFLVGINSSGDATLANQETTNIIFANPSEAMRINSSGRLLLNGTTDAGFGPLQIGNTSNATTIVQMLAANTGSNIIHFGDATSGGPRYAGYLQYDHANDRFVIGTAEAPRVYVDSNGNLLVGSTGQTYGEKFKVVGAGASGNGAYFLFSDTDDRANLILQHQGSSGGTSRTNIQFHNSSGSGVGNITTSGTGTAYNTSSDYRLKENVTTLDNAADRLAQIPVHRFNFIADPDTTVDGFLAHEVQAFVPEAVTGEKDGMREEEYVVTPAFGEIYTPAQPATYDDEGNELTPAIEEVVHSTGVERPAEFVEGQQWRETTAAVMGTRSVPDYQGIDQSKLVPLLTAALQESIDRIKVLEAEVAALKGA